MSDSTLTHISFLLDRSGSMEAIKEDIEGGFEAFIAEQKSAKGTCTVSLAQFDSVYEEVYSAVPVGDIPRFNLQPRGTTALLDSIGRVVADTKAHIKSLPKDKRPGTVVLAIMTDGMENSSREWTYESIKALIEKQTGKGWQVLYMGANQDAIEVGSRMGVSMANSVTYNTANAAAAMATTSGLISSLRADRLTDPDAVLAGYSSAQRGALG